MTLGAIKHKDVVAAAGNIKAFGWNGRGDGGACCVHGVVVSSNLTKNGNMKEGQESISSAETKGGEGLVTLSGYELALCVSVLLLKNRNPKEGDVYNPEEKLFSFLGDERKESTKAKNTTKCLQAYANKHVAFDGSRLKIAPETTAMRSASESSWHRLLGTVGALHQDMLVPEKLARVLSARHGHTLATARESYISISWADSGHEEERRENHVLMNAVHKMLFYPTEFGGGGGRWEWEGKRGLKRAKMILREMEKSQTLSPPPKRKLAFDGRKKIKAKSP